MTFLHLADLHLGKSVLEAPLIEEQRAFLQQAAACAIERRADAVVIAGDIYDRPIPSADAVELLDAFLNACNAADIPVLAISGNHDSPERLAFGSRIFARRGVHIAGVYDGTVPAIELRDAYGPVVFHLLPFLRPAMVRARRGAEVTTTDEAVRAALADAYRGDGARHVLVAHQFVCAHGQLPDTCDSETVSVGGSDAVDVSAFDGFAYVALGHLHRPQRMGRDTVRYAGSPLKYSLSEVAHTKSMPLVTLGGSDVSVELVPVTPLRDLVRIRGGLQELVEAARTPGAPTGDYVWAVLTGEAALDPAERLRAVYPYLLHVEQARPERTTAPLEDTAAAAQTPLSESALFAAFFEEVCGHPLTACQQAMLAQTAARLPERGDAS